MKISNTVIIKGLTIDGSIIAAINEMFNKQASAEFIECLVIDGFVGTCLQTVGSMAGSDAHTGYFIATIMAADFIRVDYCSVISWS
tara:strand:- start:418 stop:675 length:258 start_codon:yes stop_codon:yes gene_type:complete